MELELPPDHLVNYSNVALDDFHNLCRDVLFDVVGYRDAVVAVLVHVDGGIDCLQQRYLVNTGDEEAGLVEGFWAFRRGADAIEKVKIWNNCF